MAKSPKKITLAKELQPGDGSQKLTSAWSPLRVSLFRALWIASVASYIGTWMQDVGEAWLMTSLTTSPVLVALVETAGSLPVVLVAMVVGFAIGAGAQVVAVAGVVASLVVVAVPVIVLGLAVVLAIVAVDCSCSGVRVPRVAAGFQVAAR